MPRAADLLPTVRATIDQHDLLPRDATVVVAVSGGADSVSLLHLLNRLAPERGWRLVAASFDHGWRPASRAEAEATLAWAATLGWPTMLGRADDVRLNEAGARQQRHEFLQRCLREAGAQRIALGHSADDRAETLLLNLLRGAGYHGLGALPPRSADRVRPLLDCSRAQLAEYAARHGLPVVDDPSNDGDNLRSRLRHEVLPLLDALRPGARATLARSAAICDLDRQALDSYGQLLLAPRLVEPEPAMFLGELDAAVLDVRGWRDLPRPERHLILRAWVGRWRGYLDDVDANLIAALDVRAAGRTATQPLVWPRVFERATALRCGTRLALAQWPAVAPCDPRPLGAAAPPGCPMIVAGAVDAVLTARLRRADYQVRSPRAGDTYQPAGRPCKPLGEWLTEQHVPAPLRARVPLVVLGEAIAWLPGQKPAEGFADPDGPALGVVF